MKEVKEEKVLDSENEESAEFDEELFAGLESMSD
jgi:hypothetical protein